MKGGESAKYFYPCWNSDNHCCGRKVGPSVYVYSYREHVVGSYNEAKEADGHHCSDHAYIPERFFFT